MPIDAPTPPGPPADLEAEPLKPGDRVITPPEVEARRAQRANARATRSPGSSRTPTKQGTVARRMLTGIQTLTRSTSR